jgi:hypothetical protein
LAAPRSRDAVVTPSASALAFLGDFNSLRLFVACVCQSLLDHGVNLRLFPSLFVFLATVPPRFSQLSTSHHVGELELSVLPVGLSLETELANTQGVLDVLLLLLSAHLLALKVLLLLLLQPVSFQVEREPPEAILVVRGHLPAALRNAVHVTSILFRA